jgi:FkbM family methyltransferase
VISKVSRYISEYGLLGFIQILSNKCCGFPKTMIAYPPKLGHVVRLRLHTSDTMVFGGVIIDEEYSFGLPSSANVIVDAGADIGLTSIFYTKTFPKARIFAIEAEGSNFGLMLKNVRPYPNITPIHAALWSSDGYVSIADPLPGAFGNWGFTVSGKPGDICSITVPSLMKKFSIEHIDLLKIDIEGSEKEVFEVCDWKNQVGSIVIELHDRFRPGCSEVVNRALQGFSQTSAGDLTSYRNLGQPSAQIRQNYFPQAGNRLPGTSVA